MPVSVNGDSPMVAHKESSLPAGRSELIGIIAGFASLQLLIQAVGAFVGFAIVRTLSRDDYSSYSICTAVIAGSGVISHSGFAAAIFSRGASVRHDRVKLSQLMAAAYEYRRRITFSLVIAACGIQTVLLHRVELSWSTNLLLGISTAASVSLGARVAVNNELLTLEFRRYLIQRMNISSSMFRLAAQIALGLAHASSAIATSLVQVASLWCVRIFQGRSIREHIDSNGGLDMRDRAYVRWSFLQMLPGNILFVLQTQLVILLLAIMGHGGAVADLGAVTRYTLVFGIMGGTIGGVLVPIVARSSQAHAVRSYFFICFSVGLIGLASTVLVYEFSTPLLTLLGSSYKGLEEPLRISFAGAALGGITDAMSSLNQARGWIRGAWTQLPGVVFTVTVVIATVDVSTTTGAATLSASLVLPGILTQACQLYWGSKTSDSPSSDVSIKQLEEV